MKDQQQQYGECRSALASRDWQRLARALGELVDKNLVYAISQGILRAGARPETPEHHACINWAKTMQKRPTATKMFDKIKASIIEGDLHKAGESK